MLGNTFPQILTIELEWILRSKLPSPPSHSKETLLKLQQDFTALSPSVLGLGVSTAFFAMLQRNSVSLGRTPSSSIHRTCWLSFSWRGALQFKAGSPPKSILECSDCYLIKGMRETNRIITKDQKLLTYWKMLIFNTLINWGYTWWPLEIPSNQYHYGCILIRTPETLEGKHWKININFF